MISANRVIAPVSFRLHHRLKDGIGLGVEVGEWLAAALSVYARVTCALRSGLLRGYSKKISIARLVRATDTEEMVGASY